MNCLLFSGKALPENLGSFLVFFLVFFLSIFSVSSIKAHAADEVTFSWQANPSEDYVLGYRLYYGAESRFNSDGTLKPDFYYDYYLDFTEFVRCPGNSDGTGCDDLSDEDVQCEDLDGDTPSCTIYNLYGRLFFAMTAYNAQAESDYTQELSVLLNSPGTLAALQQVYLLLLHNNDQ